MGAHVTGVTHEPVTTSPLPSGIPRFTVPRASAPGTAFGCCDSAECPPSWSADPVCRSGFLRVSVHTWTVTGRVADARCRARSGGRPIITGTAELGLSPAAVHTTSVERNDSGSPLADRASRVSLRLFLALRQAAYLISRYPVRSVRQMHVRSSMASSLPDRSRRGHPGLPRPCPSSAARAR